VKRLRRHLTYANVVSTLCLFVLLGAGAYAAGLGKNSVKSKQIKNGSVKTQDLREGAVNAAKLATGAVGSAQLADGSVSTPKIADGSINGAKVADDSITGSDITESSLSGVDAATVDGLQAKKVNYQVSFGSPQTTVLEFPGAFRLTGSCSSAAAPFITLNAVSEANNSLVSLTGVTAEPAAGGPVSDADTNNDLGADVDFDLDAGEQFAIAPQLPKQSADNFPQAHATINYTAPGGFEAIVNLDVRVTLFSCLANGIAIGG
jgi:hypothetical protein